MRTIATGTINGVAFSLKEDGKTVCKESKYCSLISESAKSSLDKTQEEIKRGLHPTAVFNIAEDLEDRTDVKIQVDKVIEYLDGITEVHYLNMSEDKDDSKKLFLKGKFEGGGTFTISNDLSTKAIDPDGNPNSFVSEQIKILLQLRRMDFSSPSIINPQYELYLKIKDTLPGLIIEKACFYYYPPVPGRIY